MIFVDSWLYYLTVCKPIGNLEGLRKLKEIKLKMYDLIADIKVFENIYAYFELSKSDLFFDNI